jgi:hypothetical protein
VHHQRLAGRQLGQQVLAAPLDGANSPVDEAAGEVSRERATQSFPTKDDALEPRPFHHRTEPAANRFDFWQFGHASLV